MRASRTSNGEGWLQKAMDFYSTRMDVQQTALSGVWVERSTLSVRADWLCISKAAGFTLTLDSL